MNAIVGDNGILNQAISAKEETEEAELWEQIQVVLVDAYGKELEGDELVEYCNKQFDSQGLDAIIRRSEDNENGAYVLTYGIYSRNIAYLNYNLTVYQTVAAVESTSEYWDYIMNDDGSITLTVYKGSDTDIVIPNIVDGYLVTGLGNSENYIFRFSSITSVTFSEGLETIGASAFERCTSLSCEIVFPSTLVSIGDYAFYYCTSITGDLDTIISQGITLGKNVFGYDSLLEGDIAALMSTLGDDTTVISAGMFSGFSGVTGTLVIPARITSIEANAFYGCTNIEGIEFEDDDDNPSQLLTIGDYAFYKCSSMASDLVIPSQVTSIGAYAFYEDTSLKSLTLNDVITEIGEYGFYDCSGLSGILMIPNTLYNLSDYVFCNCLELEEIKFESSGLFDLTLNDGCFYNCYAITYVTLPNDKIVYVGDNCFYGCIALVTVDNSEKIAVVGKNSFRTCESLVSFLSQEICTSIGESAFSGCYSLTGNITDWIINSYVLTIGASAFTNCSSLTGSYSGSITSKAGVVKIGTGCFYGTLVESATVLNLTGKTAIDAYEFQNVTKFVDDIGNELSGDIEIPSTVTSIGAYAFAGCTALTSISIPDTVVTIDACAFYNCKNLTSVDFPSNISSVSYGCFWGSGIKSFDFNENITTLSMLAFGGCSLNGEIDLSYVTWMGSQCFGNCYSITSVIFSNDLTYLGDRCFGNSGVTGDIILGENVENIGYGTFYGTKISSLTFKNNNTIIESGSRRFM